MKLLLKATGMDSVNGVDKKVATRADTEAKPNTAYLISLDYL